MSMGKYTTVVLAGSTKFKKEYLEIAQNLTLNGFIVLMTHVFSKADKIELSKEKQIDLLKQHDQLLQEADILYVIDPEGYIGESTAFEIVKYKRYHPGNPIMYYSKRQENRMY